MRNMLHLIIWTFCISHLPAETWVNKLFSDGMVLQRNIEIAVWGSDNPGQDISASLNGESAKAKAAADGSWSLHFPQMKAGGPYELTIKGSSTKTITDVLIGEVWLCSGQSNMAFPLEWLRTDSNNPQSDTQAQLRLFKVEKSCGGDKANDVTGSWSNANGNISKWSATAYHFGNNLHKHLKVPVGLIDSSVGGTPVESWCDHKVLAGIPSIQGHVGWLHGQIKKGKMEQDNGWRPSGLYNRMIHPLLGYSIKGCIWYQGESNVGRAKEYSETFKAMITDWRSQWGIGDFPFITVQLANYIPKNDKKMPLGWAELRQAQNDSLALPNTGLALCIDIGDAGDIHPKNKKELGYRLSLQARKLAYHEDVIYSGPMFQAAAIKGKDIRVSFDHCGKGLKAEGPLSAWEIAGADKHFVTANASIDGNDVVVSADSVSDPKFVRYGWTNNPACNLYNSEGLPASPFTTNK